MGIAVTCLTMDKPSSPVQRRFPSPQQMASSTGLMEVLELFLLDLMNKEYMGRRREEKGERFRPSPLDLKQVLKV